MPQAETKTLLENAFANAPSVAEPEREPIEAFLPADQRAPGEVWDVDDDEAAAIAASAAVAEAHRPGLDNIRENWDTVEAITESMTYRDWTSWCQERG